MKKKKLQRLLSLSYELNERKNLEIDKLLRDLIASKTSMHIENAVTEMDGIEKEIVEAPTNFSEWDSSTSYERGTPVMLRGEKGYAFEVGTDPSRFMPNVKFKTFPEHSDEHERKRIFDIIKELPNFPVLYFGYRTNHDGSIIYNGFENQEMMDIYRGQAEKAEVSIYEAIPELVPDGMVYDKESDSLIEEVSLPAKRFAINYNPDDVAFKKEVVSLCGSCIKKHGCTLFSKLHGSPAIAECFDFEKVNSLFVVLTDQEGGEFAVSKEVWDVMLKKGSALQGKMS